MSSYKIINEKNGNVEYINDKLLLNTIKKLYGRDKTHQKYFIELWENLEGKKFTKKELEFL